MEKRLAVIRKTREGVEKRRALRRVGRDESGEGCDEKVGITVRK